MKSFRDRIAISKDTQAKKKDYLSIIVFIICVANILLRLPFLSLPAVGDEGIYYQAVRTIMDNHLNPFVYYWAYKPPAFLLFSSIVFTIFSPSRELGHLIVYISSSFMMAMTYIIGKRTVGKKAAFFAILLLCFSPDIVIQSFLFLDGPFLSTFMLLTCYWYLKKNTPLYLFSSFILVMTREPAFLVVVMIWLYDLYILIRTKRDSLLNFFSHLIYLFPVSAFFIWMGMNKIIFGTFLFQENANLITFQVPTLFHNLKLILSHSGIWIFITLSLYTCLTMYIKKKTINESAHTVILFMLIVISYMLFSACGFYWPRYIFPVYPFLFLTASYGVVKVYKKTRTLIFIWFIILFFLIFSYTVKIISKPITGTWGEDDIVRIVNLSKKTVNFLTKSYPTAFIITPYAENNQIYINPFFGYVNKETSFTHAAYWDCDFPNPRWQMQYIASIPEHTELLTQQTPIIYIDTSSYSGVCRYPPENLQLKQSIYSQILENSTAHTIYEVKE